MEPLELEKFEDHLFIYFLNDWAGIKILFPRGNSTKQECDFILKLLKKKSVLMNLSGLHFLNKYVYLP